jgi:hypothetical protein
MDELVADDNDDNYDDAGPINSNDDGNTASIVRLLDQALRWIAADCDQGLTERGPSGLQRRGTTQHIDYSYSFTRLLNHAPCVMCYIELAEGSLDLLRRMLNISYPRPRFERRPSCLVSSARRGRIAIMLCQAFKVFFDSTVIRVYIVEILDGVLELVCGEIVLTELRTQFSQSLFIGTNGVFRTGRSAWNATPMSAATP